MIQNQAPHLHASSLDWALFYASQGWPVLPLYGVNPKGQCHCNRGNCNSIGKHPCLRNGHKEASLNTNMIKDWWSKWPNANVGILTGERSGLLVVDIDPRHGGHKSIKNLKGPIEDESSLKVKTGGDGLHYYFQYPKGKTVKNHVNFLPGIDIRGEGGYIVAPPSKHAMGSSYRWDLLNQEPKNAPTWFIDALNRPTLRPQRKKSTVKLPSISNGAKVSEGTRNQFLMSIGGTLRKFGLSRDDLLNELGKINHRLCYPPLDQKEVDSVASSLAKYDADPNHQWSKLSSLPDLDLKAPNLDLSLVPEVLQPWIGDIAQRMQVPLDFIASGVIVSVSSLIGRKLGIRPKKNDNWLVIPNLWGGIIGGPGTFKSPAIYESMKPLETLAKARNKKYEAEKAEWEIEKEITEATISAVKEQLIKAIKKSNLEDADRLKIKLTELTKTNSSSEPTCERLKTNDTTIEKLSQLFIENPAGLMLARDELAGWLCSLQKYGREGDREFYLESWNGNGQYTVDRIGRGTTHIPALCLSIFGGIQPDKLQRYLTSTIEGNDDGLLQRFQILVYPELDGQWVNIDQQPDEMAYQKVLEIFKQIEQFSYDHEDHEVQAIRFSEKAQLIFDKWRENLEIELRSGTLYNPAFEGHLSKYRSLMPSLALVFHVLRYVGDYKRIKEKSVGVSEIELAIKWTEYLKLHAKKVYQIHGDPLRLTTKAILEKIKLGLICDGDSIRSIQRRQWKHIKNTQEIKKSFNYLEKFNYAKLINQSNSNRESLRVRLNPAL